jgi:hypothetical protein
MLQVERFRARPASVRFRHFQPACEIQVHEFHLILLFYCAIEAILGCRETAVAVKTLLKLNGLGISR